MTEPNHIHEDEIWKPVPGFEAVYSVSSAGRIRRDTFARGCKGRYLRGWRNHDGYQAIELRKDGKDHRLLVHRLVWLAFFGDIPPGYEINHKDGNKQNNTLANMECVTHQENMRHATEVLGAFIGRKPIYSYTPERTRGERNCKAKLTNAQVLEIRAIYDRTPKKKGLYIRLSQQFGVSWSTINVIVNRRAWRHLPDAE